MVIPGGFTCCNSLFAMCKLAQAMNFHMTGYRQNQRRCRLWGITWIVTKRSKSDTDGGIAAMSG